MGMLVRQCDTKTAGFSRDNRTRVRLRNQPQTTLQAKISAQTKQAPTGIDPV